MKKASIETLIIENLTTTITLSLKSLTLTVSNTDEAQTDKVVEDDASVIQFMKKIKLRGKTIEFYHQDARLHIIDDVVSWETYEKEYFGVDREELRKAEEGFNQL